MQVADPLGGSFYVEALTTQMEQAAEAIIQEVEQMGGMTEAIISGGWVRQAGLVGTLAALVGWLVGWLLNWQ